MRLRFFLLFQSITDFPEYYHSHLKLHPRHNYYYNRSIGGRLLRRPVYGTMGER